MDLSNYSCFQTNPAKHLAYAVNNEVVSFFYYAKHLYL